MDFRPRRTSRNARPGRGDGYAVKSVLVTINSSGRRSPQVCIKIGRDIMAEMGWRVGNKAFVQTGLVGKRAAIKVWVDRDGSHTLSDVRANRDRTATATVKITCPEIAVDVKPLVGRYMKPTIDANAIIVVDEPTTKNS